MTIPYVDIPFEIFTVPRNPDLEMRHPSTRYMIDSAETRDFMNRCFLRRGFNGHDPEQDFCPKTLLGVPFNQRYFHVFSMNPCLDIVV